MRCYASGHKNVMFSLYPLIRPWLFRMEPEQAHAFCLALLDYIPTFCFPKVVGKPVAALGMTFPHAVGLAAGLDKNAAHLSALAKLGFAFIEVGTITPKPQEGNPKPRLFRIPQADALINRMGFNNLGVDALIHNIRRAQYTGILGINIGKNKLTPLMQAADDYVYCLRKVYPYASYVTINISSPNTPDLRLLQQHQYLDDLLSSLTLEQQRLMHEHQKKVPLVIKISPDEDDETLKRMADAVLTHGISGIIATNTTNKREGITHLPYAMETGGLSGKPLADSAQNCLQLFKSYIGNEITLISAGGIDAPYQLQQRLAAGAQLAQVYTGLIFKGPGLIPDLIKSVNIKA